MPTAPDKACLVCGRPSPESYCPEHRQTNPGAQVRAESDRYRAQQAYRKLYQTTGWKQNVRPFVLNRDPLCTLQITTICKARGGDPSTVVDHIVDHKGDPKLFYDVKNCRGVCKPCHDERTGGEHGFQAKKPGGINWNDPFSIPETA